MAVRIQLDQDPTAPYTNLDVVSGRILLNLPVETSISAINVKLEGECHTRLMGPRPSHERSDKKRTEVELHKVLYLVQTVFPSSEMQQEAFGNVQYRLPPGQFIYPFTFKLPINNDCSQSHGLFNDLTLNLARTQFRHVKKTLPPSLDGFPGLAVIKYYVKVTVVRPKFYQENLRELLAIRFMPIEDPRPQDTNEETFARRKQQFQQVLEAPSKKGLFKRSPTNSTATPQTPPTVQVDARLPNPAIITRHDPLPLRVLVRRLDDSDATMVLGTFEVNLIAYTEVRALDLTRVEVGTYAIISHTNLKTPLNHRGDDKSQNEWKLPSSLWGQIPVPIVVAPSFETCNISRRYELDIRVGLSYENASGVRSEPVVVPLRIPVKVYSGIRPPPELLARMASKPGAQHLGPIFPRPSQQIPSSGLHPGLATPTTPTHDQSTQPALLGSPNPLQDNIPDEAPPSYEDVMAEDLAPVNRPRQSDNTPETRQQPTLNPQRNLSLGRGEGERTSSSNQILESGTGTLVDIDNGPAPELPPRAATGRSDILQGDQNAPNGSTEKGGYDGDKKIREI